MYNQTYEERLKALDEKIKSIEKSIVFQTQLLNTIKEERDNLISSYQEGSFQAIRTKKITRKEQIQEEGLMRYIDQVDMSPKSKNIVTEVIKSGKTQKDLAKEFDVSSGYVHQVLETFIRKAHVIQKNET